MIILTLTLQREKEQMHIEPSIPELPRTASLPCVQHSEDIGIFQFLP